jgi:hypothetical protein
MNNTKKDDTSHSCHICKQCVPKSEYVICEHCNVRYHFMCIDFLKVRTHAQYTCHHCFTKDKCFYIIDRYPYRLRMFDTTLQ